VIVNNDRVISITPAQRNYVQYDAFVQSTLTESYSVQFVTSRILLLTVDQRSQSDVA